MKSLVTIALATCALWSTPSLAATEIFEGKAEYTKAGWDSKWSELEKLGIERVAEKRAFAACQRSGATDCVILEGANIDACGYMTAGGSGNGCKASAAARGTL